MVDFVRTWAEKTELPVEKFVGWLGVARGKFFDWRTRYGKANEHNALMPRDHWLEYWEKKAIIDRTLRGLWRGASAASLA